MRAVPAGLVQCDQLQRFNVDDQRQLALTRLAHALWAFHESHVCIHTDLERTGSGVAACRDAQPTCSHVTGSPLADHLDFALSTTSFDAIHGSMREARATQLPRLPDRDS